MSVVGTLKLLCVQVLLKWNLQRGVAVIPRSQSEKNIKANIDGAFSWELTPEQKVRPSRESPGYDTTQPKYL